MWLTCAGEGARLVSKGWHTTGSGGPGDPTCHKPKGMLDAQLLLHSPGIIRVTGVFSVVPRSRPAASAACTQCCTGRGARELVDAGERNAWPHKQGRKNATHRYCKSDLECYYACEKRARARIALTPSWNALAFHSLIYRVHEM